MYRLTIANLKTGSTVTTSYSHLTEAEHNFKIAARSMLYEQPALVQLKDCDGSVIATKRLDHHKQES